VERRVTVLLYRPSLDLDSGAGQLILTQWRALRAAGVAAEIGCERGALKFFLRAGVVPRRLARSAVGRLQRGDTRFVVDHGLCVPEASIVFVHNLAAEASLHVAGVDWAPRVEAERAYFRDLAPSARIVANSELVNVALRKHFGLAPERIVVHCPGFRSDRFTPARVAELRAGARRALRLDGRTPLVGFVTSGDFAKRGLDLFLASAEEIYRARPEVRFLVVGSKRLPSTASDHDLVERGIVQHRPKTSRPERWFAALDLFLYAARFEEFGMVISEAQAVGVPIVTSRLVGAAQCLAPAYQPWLPERPGPAELAARALALLADASLRRDLAQAGIAHAASVDDREYARATLATILAQKRQLKYTLTPRKS
jgi:glycosyltransferase involved in cell wall biosynthesis